MKRSSLLRIKALLLAGAIGVPSMTVNAKIPNKDEIIEEAFENLTIGCTIKDGETVYVSNDEPTIETNYELIDRIKLGDIVVANGIGSSTCENMISPTKYYNNQLFAVVGVKSNYEYSYALASINEDQSLGEVVGWFPLRSIKSRIKITTKRKHANVVKSINSAKQVGMNDLYDENGIWCGGTPLYGILSDYTWYGDEHGIKVYYQYDNEYDKLNQNTGILTKITEITRDNIDYSNEELEEKYKIKSIY